MNANHLPALATIASSTLFLIGCSAAPQTIPLGQWTGQGVFVDSEIITGEKLDDLIKSRSSSQPYDTTLKITEQTIHGTDTLCFKIRSKRHDKLFFLGDTFETQLQFNLVPIETLPNGSVLYAQAHASLEPEKDELPTADELAKRIRIPLAVLTHQPGCLVLQVTYAPPDARNELIFEDTFVFESGRLRKTGKCLIANNIKAKDGTPQQKITQIYWTETLKKTK